MNISKKMIKNVLIETARMWAVLIIVGFSVNGFIALFLQHNPEPFWLWVYVLVIVFLCLAEFGFNDFWFKNQYLEEEKEEIENE